MASSGTHTPRRDRADTDMTSGTPTAVAIGTSTPIIGPAMTPLTNALTRGNGPPNTKTTSQ